MTSTPASSVVDRRFRTVLGRSGIFNARDLGGLPADGGTTRFGLLVRGDSLHRARPDAAQGLADRAVAQAFGVKRMGPIMNKRATFVIGAGRKVLAAISSELNMEVHADEALKVLRSSAAA